MARKGNKDSVAEQGQQIRVPLEVFLEIKEEAAAVGKRLRKSVSMSELLAEVWRNRVPKSERGVGPDLSEDAKAKAENEAVAITSVLKSEQETGIDPTVIVELQSRLATCDPGKRAKIAAMIRDIVDVMTDPEVHPQALYVMALTIAATVGSKTDAKRA